MGKIISLVVAVVVQCICFPIFANDLEHSGRSERSDNPFLAYGYNPKTQVITGYLAAFRTAPGRTDACKLVFKGHPNRLMVKYLEENWVYGDQNQSDANVSITTKNNESFIKIPKIYLGGDCDWILPFKVGPRVVDTPDEVAVTMKVSNVGDWIGVYAISAKQAKVHSRPNSASVRKAYLVEGNVIYVYDEQPDWYFVQYDNGEKKTVGWIRKADTVQP